MTPQGMRAWFTGVVDRALGLRQHGPRKRAESRARAEHSEERTVERAMELSRTGGVRSMSKDEFMRAAIGPVEGNGDGEEDLFGGLFDPGSDGGERG